MTRSKADRIASIPRSVPQGVGLGLLTGSAFVLLFALAAVIRALITAESLRKSGYPIPWTWALGLNSTGYYLPIFGAAPLGAAMLLARRLMPPNVVVRGLVIGGLAALVLDRPAVSVTGVFDGLLMTFVLYLASGVFAVAVGDKLLAKMPERVSPRSAPWYVVAWLLVALGALGALFLQLTLLPGFGE